MTLRLRPRWSPASRSVLAGLMLLATFLGCSTATPVQPDRRMDHAISSVGSTPLASGFGAASFYPLKVGNRWEYSGESRFALVDPEVYGGPVVVDVRYTESHSILGEEERDGHVYALREEVREVQSGSYFGSGKSWSRMRQDRSGLYAANMPQEPPSITTSAGATQATSVHGLLPGEVTAFRERGFSEDAIARFTARIVRLRMAARGAGRALSERGRDSDAELTWLLYPLRLGAEWNMVPGLEWPARVGRIETLETRSGRLVAYRIETNPGGEPMKEGEYVRLWYGRAGYVGYSLHLWDVATDADGNPTRVTATFDDTMILTDAELRR